MALKEFCEESMPMQGLYYTICSLPHLYFGATPPLTAAAFLALCEIEASPESMSTLVAISLLPPRTRSPLPAIERWYGWESGLRLELARLRATAGHGQVDLNPWPAEDIPFAQRDLADRAVAQESPAEAEDLLDLARWRFLMELESAHNFGLPKLGLYFLKLQLLERRARFNQAAGLELRRAILNRVHLPAAATSLAGLER